MLKNKSTNYNYVVFAVVILALMCLLMYEFRTEYHSKNIPDAQRERRTCRVHTKKGTTALDPNIFEIHLRHTRDNLDTLNQGRAVEHTPKLKAQVAEAKKATSSYIALNLYNTGIQPMVNDYMEQEKLQYEKCPKNSINAALYDNSYFNSNDAGLQSEIGGLVTDIDIIIQSMRADGAPKGELDLVPVNALTEGLYATRSQETNADQLNHMLDILDKKYDTLFQEKFQKKTKEGFLVDDLGNDLKVGYWHWYDIAGTNDMHGKETMHNSTNSKKPQTRKNNATCMERTLDGSQSDRNYDVSNAIACVREQFDLPKNKSHNVSKMASSAHSINNNPFISQGVEREFSSNNLYKMRNQDISSKKSFIDGGSVFANQIDNTRSSLMG